MRTQFECPVSGERSKPVVNAPEAGEVTFEEVEEDDTVLPVGWGDVTLRSYVNNPEYDEIQRLRAEQLGQYDAALADPEVPEEQKAILRATFADKLDESLPLPAPNVWQQHTWEHLSPTAVAIALKALRDAGFPVPEAAS